MRLTCLTLALALALCSLAFAPAPFPREREARAREKALRECEKRLEYLGVNWMLTSSEGQPELHFYVRHPVDPQRGMGGLSELRDGDLLRTLQHVQSRAEAYRDGQLRSGDKA